MKEYDISEYAYKNGFEDGRASVLKHGTWMAMHNPLGELIGWRHDECGAVTCYITEYCPTCGAKMDLEDWT